MKQILIVLMAFANIQDSIDEYRKTYKLKGFAEKALEYMIGEPYAYKSKRTTTTVEYFNRQTGRWDLDNSTTSETVFYSMENLYPTYTRREYDPNAFPEPRWILVDGMWVSGPIDDHDREEPADPNATMNRIKALIENDPNNPDNPKLKALLEIVK